MATLGSNTNNTLSGSIAPSFALKNEKGTLTSLEDLTTNGPLMLVFYPGDFTLVCTKQLCSYQNMSDEFKKFKIQIAGISHNTEDSHLKFKERYNFSFPLLSDPGKQTFKTYGVTSLFMFGGTSRAVFIISKKNRILYRHVEPTIITHRKTPELLHVLGELSDSKLLD